MLTFNSHFVTSEVLWLILFSPGVFPSQGGRKVLFLYGYTNQQVDGLSFPDEVSEPDTDKVAAVTLEVMTLRTEVDMLVKVGLLALIVTSSFLSQSIRIHSS